MRDKATEEISTETSKDEAEIWINALKSLSSAFLEIPRRLFSVPPPAVPTNKPSGRRIRFNNDRRAEFKFIQLSSSSYTRAAIKQINLVMEINCCSISTWLHQKWANEQCRRTRSQSDFQVQECFFHSEVRSVRALNSFVDLHSSERVSNWLSISHRSGSLKGFHVRFEDWLKCRSMLKSRRPSGRGIPTRLIVSLPAHTSRCFLRNKSIERLSSMQIRICWVKLNGCGRPSKLRGGSIQD